MEHIIWKIFCWKIVDKNHFSYNFMSFNESGKYCPFLSDTFFFNMFFPCIFFLHFERTMILTNILPWKIIWFLYVDSCHRLDSGFPVILFSYTYRALLNMLSRVKRVLYKESALQEREATGFMFSFLHPYNCAIPN